MSSTSKANEPPAPPPPTGVAAHYNTTMPAVESVPLIQIPPLHCGDCLTKPPPGRDLSQGWFGAETASSASMRRFFDASKEFYNKTPWHTCLSRHLFEVRMPDIGSHHNNFVYFGVVGSDPYSIPGLVAYRTQQSIYTPNSTEIAVMEFVPPAGRPAEELALLKANRLPMTGNVDPSTELGEFVPKVVLWGSGGQQTQPSLKDIEWIELAMHAIIKVLPKLRLSTEGFLSAPDPAKDKDGADEDKELTPPRYYDIMETVEVTPPVGHQTEKDTAEVMVRFPPSSFAPYTCFVCNQPATVVCPWCRTMCYCGPAHEEYYRKWHGKFCTNMSLETVRRERIIEDFPFTFKREVTSLIEDYTYVADDFLVKRGIYGVGLWKRVWGCLSFNSAPFGSLADLTRMPNREDWCLPADQTPVYGPIPAEIAGTPAAQPQTWAEYYALRKISLDSPAAILLTFPLTVYHLLMKLAERSTHPDILKPGSSICVELIGVAKELDQAPVFGDLAYLLPGVKIHIVFIGHEIGSSVPDELPNALGHPDLTFTIHRGDYLTWLERQAKPSPGVSQAPAATCAIALNCGIGAYPEWVPCLKALLDSKLPSFFTDYCEASAEVGRDVVRTELSTDFSVPTTLNPFRCPVSRKQRGLGSSYPEYSNGFYFGLN